MAKTNAMVARNVGYFILFLGITSLIYFNSFTSGFVGDDLAVIPDNFANLGDPSKIISYFKHGVWFHTNTGFDDYSIYRPLWLVWEFLVYQLSGENPLIWHISNLVLHALNALLLFFLARLLYPASSSLIRVCLAIIFLIYPIVSHNVIWVSGSTDLLLTVWYLSTLISYIKYRESGKEIWFYLSVLTFICAIFTKEMGITLIPLLIVIDSSYKVKFRDQLRNYLIITILVSGYIALRVFALGHATGEASGWQINAESMWRAVEYGSIYLRTLFFPWPLPITVRHLPTGLTTILDPYLGLLLLLLLIYLTFKFPKTRLGIGLIVMPLVIPVLLAFSTFGLFATRFLYLSVVGLVLLLTPLFNARMSQIEFRIAYGLAIIVLGTMTIVETYNWKNQGSFAAKLVLYDTNHADNWISQANYYKSKSQTQKAINIFHQATSVVSPESERMQVIRALALLYAENGSYDQSIEEYRKLKSAEGFEHLGWTGIGNNLWMLGRLEDASSAYYEALSTDPEHISALYNLGLINARLKRFSLAIEAYETLSRLPPGVGSPGLRNQVESNLRKWRLKAVR